MILPKKTEVENNTPQSDFPQDSPCLLCPYQANCGNHICEDFRTFLIKTGKGYLFDLPNKGGNYL